MKTFFFLFLLFVGSFLLRCWYIDGTSMITPIRSDALLYTTIAYDLANNGAYYTDQYSDEFQAQLNSRDPGYSFFLALVLKVTDLELKDFFFTTVWIQSVIGAATVVISYFLSRFFLPIAWSVVVSLLTMLSPHLISMTNYILTETLFTFFLQAAIILYIYSVRGKKPWILGCSSLAFGIAICIRSVILFFPLILAAMTFYYFRHQRKTAITATLILLTVPFIFFVPWKIWSSSVLKDVKSPPSLLMGTLLVGSYIGLMYDGIPKDNVRYGPGMPYRVDPRYQEIISGGYSGIFREIGKRFTENPITYSLWYLSGKPAMFWRWNMLHGVDINDYPVEYTWYDNNEVMRLTKNVMQLLHPIIIVMMHIGAIFFILRKKTLPETQWLPMCAILMLLVYLLFIHVVLTPAPRYSIPLRPIMYLMAVVGLVEIGGKVKKHTIVLL